MEEKTNPGGRGIHFLYILSLILIIPCLALSIYLCVQKFESKRMGGAASFGDLSVVAVTNPVELLGQGFNGYEEVVVRACNPHDLTEGDLVAYYVPVDNVRQTSQVSFARVKAVRSYAGGYQLSMSDMADNIFTDRSNVIGKYEETGRFMIFVLNAATSDLGVALIAIIPIFILMLIQVIAYVAVAKEKEAAITSTELALYDMNQTALVYDDNWEPGTQTGPTLALQSAEQAKREQMRSQQQMRAQQMQQRAQQGTQQGVRPPQGPPQGPPRK